MKKWVFCPLCNGKTRLQIIETTKMKDFPLFCPKCKKEMLIKVNHYEVKMILKIKQVAYEKDSFKDHSLYRTGCVFNRFIYESSDL